MNQILISNTVKILVVASIVAIIFFAGVVVRGFKADRDISKIKEEQAAALVAQRDSYISRIVERDKKNQELSTQLSQLEALHQVVLNEQIRKNSSLRNDLAVANRMSIKGASCIAGTPSTSATGTSPVGNATQVSLSTETRYAVFDLRESIIRDVEALEYLKGYIRRLGLDPASPEERKPR